MEPRKLSLIFSSLGVYHCITNLLYFYTSQRSNVDWSHMTFLLSVRSMREDRKERMNCFSQKASESLYHCTWHTWMINVPIWGDVGVWWKMCSLLGRVILHWGMLSGNLLVTNLNRASIGINSKYCLCCSVRRHYILINQPWWFMVMFSSWWVCCDYMC